MRRILKNIIVYFCILLVLPCIFLAWVEKKVCEKEEIFSFFAQILSLIPGKVGSYFRVAYYMGTLDKCPAGTFIAFGSFFPHRNVVLEENVGIGAYCVIGCAHIGRDTMFASRVSVTSGKIQHIAPDGRITRNVTLQTVVIGEKSWIGEGAIVMDDVGDECIVAAGCVVSKKIPSEALAGGNPCRILKRKYYDTTRRSKDEE